MPNIGVIPGDLIIPGATNWPGLQFRQAIERGLGHRLATNGDNLTGYFDARVSPDNQRLVLLYGTSNAAPRVYNALDGDTGWTNAATTMPGSQFASCWRPDGSEFAVSSNTSPYIRRWNTSDLSQIPDFSTGELPLGAAGDLAYSPDGRYLAVGSDRGSTFTAPGIDVYDLTTGTRVALGGTLPTSNVMGLDFSPDGTTLFCIPRTSGHASVVFDTTTWLGTAVPGITALGTQDKCVAYSPAGDQIAIVRGGSSATSTFAVADASTYAMKALPAGLPGTAARWVEWIDNSLLAVAYATQQMIHIFDTSGPTLQLVSKVFDASATRFGVVGGGAKRYFAGTVKDASDNPLEREVRVYHRATGRFLASTMSSAVDGSFSVMVTCPQPCTVMAIGTGGEIVELFDSVTPVATLP